MSEIQQKILLALEHAESLNSFEFADAINTDHGLIVGALKSLQSFPGLLELDQKPVTKTQLTDEGRKMVASGSHEFLVYTAVPAGQSIKQTELLTRVPPESGKIGMSKALASRWLEVKKNESGEVEVRRTKDSVTDTVRELLERVAEMRLSDVKDNDLKDLRKRNLIEDVKTTAFIARRGPEFRTSGIQKDETELTAELLQGGAWRARTFKRYNFDALGSPVACGYLHPLLKVRAEVRNVLLEMGFSEMPTNKFVESSFWNFDALFQPQAHPARDAQDTFFILDPEHTVRLPDEPDCETEGGRSYLERVSRVHSVGAYGSRGYQTNWNIA